MSDTEQLDLPGKQADPVPERATTPSESSYPCEAAAEAIPTSERPTEPRVADQPSRKPGDSPAAPGHSPAIPDGSPVGPDNHSAALGDRAPTKEDLPPAAKDSLGGSEETEPAPKDPLTKRTQWSNWTVLAMIILCFFLIVRFRPFESRSPQGRPGVGSSLRALNLQPLREDLKPLTLADLTGRVVLLSFWGPWSSVSRQALPHLAQLGQTFHDQPAFRLAAVACRQESSQTLSELRRRTRELLRKKGLLLSVYTDYNGVSRAAVDQAVGLHGFPTTVILDRQGRIRGVWSGYHAGDEDEMQQLITQLLAE